ncbi:hypothetical protein ACOMHN_021266 [Nucella lapillus]
MTDFERPLMNACHEVTGRPVHGCWFHYSQALFRRIHKLGLLHPFRRVTSFNRLIHKYMALPLLPSTRIEEGLDELQNEAPQIPPENQRKLEVFRRHVRSFWMQKVTPSRMTVFGLSRRSNNSIESFHAMLKRKIGVAHPNFYVFIDHLNKVIESKLADLKSLDSGMPLSRRKPRQQLINEDRLRRLEQQLSEDEISSGVFLTNSCLYFHRYANAIGAAGNDTPGDSESDVSEVEQLAEEEHLHVQVQQRQDQEVDQVQQRQDQEVEQTRQETLNLCPVCLTSSRNAVIIPCGHSACIHCADKIWKMVPLGNKCHECRGPIANVVRVFGMS